VLDILEAAMYAVIFLAVGIPILIAGWFVLDALTPGHKLGEKLNPAPLDGSGALRQGVNVAGEGSHSAALVAGTWMIMQSLIVLTAIWTNAHGTDLGQALGWTVAFSVIGLVLQSAAFIALDAITPGNLGDEVCIPGPVVPLAKVAAANIVAVGLIVVAVIS
jgi:hypothetical protein